MVVAAAAAVDEAVQGVAAVGDVAGDVDEECEKLAMLGNMMMINLPYGKRAAYVRKRGTTFGQQKAQGTGIRNLPLREIDVYQGSTALENGVQS